MRHARRLGCEHDQLAKRPVGHHCNLEHVSNKTGSEFGEEWNDLKTIPEEFQEGLEEVEIEARSKRPRLWVMLGRMARGSD